MVTIWIAVAYISIVLAVGLVMRGRGGGIGEFLVARRQLSWFLVAPFLIAQWIGTVITVGNAEIAHMTGVAGLWYFIGAAAGAPLLILMTAKVFSRLKSELTT